MFPALTTLASIRKDKDGKFMISPRRNPVVERWSDLYDKAGQSCFFRPRYVCPPGTSAVKHGSATEKSASDAIAVHCSRLWAKNRKDKEIEAPLEQKNRRGVCFGKLWEPRAMNQPRGERSTIAFVLEVCARDSTATGEER